MKISGYIVFILMVECVALHTYLSKLQSSCVDQELDNEDSATFVVKRNNAMNYGVVTVKVVYNN